MRLKLSALAAFCILLTATPISAQIEGSYFAVIVNDIEASAEWYQSTFRLSVGARSSEPGRYKIVNLSKRGVFVELLELDDASERPEGKITGPFKIGWLVNDLNQFIAQLPDSISDPRVIFDSENKLNLIQLRDPDGNIIQIMQMLEGADGVTVKDP
jgi:hypothetical protein